MSTYIENLVNAKLKNMKNLSNTYEIGHVRKVKDYILEVSGLESGASMSVSQWQTTPSVM